jgi:hypothetical protein
MVYPTVAVGVLRLRTVTMPVLVTARWIAI